MKPSPPTDLSLNEILRRALARLVALVLVASALLLPAAGCSESGDARPGNGNPPPDPPRIDTYRIVAEYPHDQGAFTQGLVYIDSTLYEGTGIKGFSSLRRVDLETGEVLQQRGLDAAYFGEGIAVVGDRIFQLTWQGQRGFIYDRASFDPVGEFTYASEGWGLTYDGTHLIRSDGTATLTFHDPNGFAPVRQVQVTDDKGAVGGLNELEYIRGEVWANIYNTTRIARIDPATGAVTAYLDLGGLLPQGSCPQFVEVLNGIAWDEAGERLFVTGKRWCRLFHIEPVGS